MLSNYRIVMDAILIGLLFYNMAYSGMWHIYTPRPGFECVVYGLNGVFGMDCYKVETGK